MNRDHPDLSMHEWKREPGAPWIDRLPDLCSLTLVGTISDNIPQSAGPAFTTAFKTLPSPMPVDEFLRVERAELDVELPGPENRLKIHFKAFEHSCDDCPPPRHFDIRFEANNHAIEAFWRSVEANRKYLWILSTPEYEGRALIDFGSGNVTAKFTIDRQLQ
jgi:hypothetical protein